MDIERSPLEQGHKIKPDGKVEKGPILEPDMTDYITAIYSKPNAPTISLMQELVQYGDGFATALGTYMPESFGRAAEYYFEAWMMALQASGGLRDKDVLMCEDRIRRVDAAGNKLMARANSRKRDSKATAKQALDARKDAKLAGAEGRKHQAETLMENAKRIEAESTKVSNESRALHDKALMYFAKATQVERRMTKVRNVLKHKGVEAAMKFDEDDQRELSLGWADNLEGQIANIERWAQRVNPQQCEILLKQATALRQSASELRAKASA